MEVEKEQECKGENIGGGDDVWGFRDEGCLRPVVIEENEMMVIPVKDKVKGVIMIDKN